MVRSDCVHPPLGRPQAQKGVGKWSPEALACTVLMPQPWILGKLFNILALWIIIIGIFWYHPQGRPQVQKGVGKWSPEALACTVLMPQPWILGKLFNIVALWINYIGIFWYHPQSDSWECWNIEAWGPGLHNFKTLPYVVPIPNATPFIDFGLNVLATGHELTILIYVVMQPLNFPF